MINVTESFLPPKEAFDRFMNRVWESKWVTNRGALVLELEQALRERLGVGSLLLVNNGTIALQLALKSLGRKGEVITTPFSYVATVSSIVWEDHTPVFVDIDPEFLTIDETKIEAAVTDKTVAILATHVYGNPCEVDSIERIADTHGLKVIYDAAHCFGVKYNGRSILSWGDMSTLSFHATKLFHTGEGGAVVTNHEQLVERIYYMHNFGHNGPESFFGLGVNGKMSEISAAMGLAVLPHVDDIILDRKRVADRYMDQLSDSNIELLKIRPKTDWNYSYFPILFDSENALKSCQADLNASQIFPRRYFYPSLNTLPYLEGNTCCPVAEDISSRVMCLPLYFGLSRNDIDRICQIVLRKS